MIIAVDCRNRQIEKSVKVAASIFGVKNPLTAKGYFLSYKVTKAIGGRRFVRQEI